MCIVDIVDSLMSSNVLVASSRSTYIRYSRVGKMMIKHKSVTLLVMNLCRDAPAAKKRASGEESGNHATR